MRKELSIKVKSRPSRTQLRIWRAGSLSGRASPVLAVTIYRLVPGMFGRAGVSKPSNRGLRIRRTWHLQVRPKAAHCGDFEERLHLEDELLLLPSASPALGTLLSLLPIYFSDRAPWADIVAKVSNPLQARNSLVTPGSETKKPPPIREAAFASLKAPPRPVPAPVDPTDCE